MSLIDDQKTTKKPKKTEEQIAGIFTTISLRKTNIIDDTKKCIKVFEKIKQQLKLKRILKKTELYFVIMEFGKSGDHPHIHIVHMYTTPQSHTQIARMIRYPVCKILNPLDTEEQYWCKSKVCGNKEYLLDKYLKKEQKDKRCLTIQHNVDWKQVKQINDIWLDNNLHRKPLKLKYITKPTLPNRIIDYAEWKKMKLNTIKQYTLVIEAMYRDKYNMSCLYMSNSLMKQTYNCIKILLNININYYNDYNIRVENLPAEEILNMSENRKVVSKRTIELLQYQIKTL